MIMLVTVCNDVVAVMGGGGAFVIYRSETMKGALPCQLANESFARICRASSQQSKNSTLVGLHNAERGAMDDFFLFDRLLFVVSPLLRSFVGGVW